MPHVPGAVRSRPLRARNPLVEGWIPADRHHQRRSYSSSKIGLSTKPRLVRVPDRLGAVPDAELPIDVRQVELHRLLRDPELLRDLLVRQAAAPARRGSRSRGRSARRPSRRSMSDSADADRLRTRCPPPPRAASPAGRSGRRSCHVGGRALAERGLDQVLAGRRRQHHDLDCRDGACGSRRGRPARPCAASAGRAAPGRGSCGRRAGAPASRSASRRRSRIRRPPRAPA